MSENQLQNTEENELEISEVVNQEIEETVVAGNADPQEGQAVEVKANQTAIPVASVNEKKPMSKKKIGIIIGVIAVAVIAFIVAYFAVIRPNAIYKDAVAALERSDFYGCQQLIDKIPNHKDVPALKKELTYAMARSYIDEGDLDMAESLLAALPGDAKALKIKQDIQYLRAAELVEQGKIDDAKLLLDKIPDHEDPKQLREQISYETAVASLEKGDYKTAYELFSQLGDYKDAAKQKETTYYEALAFKSLFNIQKLLKNPASLRVTKVTFYHDSSKEGELDAIYGYTASNSYGGNVGGYGYDLTLYDDTDNSGAISQSAYYDPDDYYELLEQMLVDAIKKQSVLTTSVDIARMNRLLAGNASFNIDLPFKAADSVES